MIRISGVFITVVYDPLSKARMAARMGTSRSQLDRLLDPENERVTLQTLKRAAAAVGMHLELGLR